MSVWRIGTQAALGDTGPAADITRGSGTGNGGSTTAAGGFEEIFDRLIKWIPGDTLAIYVPAVTALGASSNHPSVLLLVVMIVVTPLFAVGAAFAVGKVSRRVIVSAVLAAIAFAIWSMSVPMSGWQQWHVIANNTAGFAIGAAVAGALFGYFAEGIMLRAAPQS